VSRRKSQKFPGYLTQQLFMSQAYRTMKPASKEIFTMLLFDVKIASKNKKGKYVPFVENRHELMLPYAQITEYLGYKDKAIWTAFKELLEHGFITIEKQGGSKKGDANVYGLSEDWRKWEPGMIIREIKIRAKKGWEKPV
jgi:hypothetical protein